MSTTNPQPPSSFPERDTQLWLDRGYTITASGHNWVTLTRPKHFSILAFMFTLWLPYLIYYALKRDDRITIRGAEVFHNGKKIQGPIDWSTKIIGLIIVLMVTLFLTRLTGSSLILLLGFGVFMAGVFSKTKKGNGKVVHSK